MAATAATADAATVLVVVVVVEVVVVVVVVEVVVVNGGTNKFELKSIVVQTRSVAKILAVFSL